MRGFHAAFRHFRAFRGQKFFTHSARLLCQRLNQRFPSALKTRRSRADLRLGWGLRIFQNGIRRASEAATRSTLTRASGTPPQPGTKSASNRKATNTAPRNPHVTSDHSPSVRRTSRPARSQRFRPVSAFRRSNPHHVLHRDSPASRARCGDGIRRTSGSLRMR